MSEWKEYTLGSGPLQILDGDRGKNYPKNEEFEENGHCLFLNTKNVTPNGFAFNELNFISKYRDGLLGKGKLHRFDLILTTRGTVGNVAFYNETIPYENIRINSGMVIIRPNGINPEFSYQLFKFLKSEFNVFVSGSAQPQLPIRDLRQIRFQLPPPNEQTAIANILSSLDDKIDLLHRQNQTLEKMAETLFRQWFVEEAKEEWEETTLSKYINVKHGYAFKGGDIITDSTNNILVTPGNFKIGGGFKSDKFKYVKDIIFPAAYVFSNGDLVVTMTDLSVDGSTLGYPALIPKPLSTEKYLHNQRVGKIEFKDKIGKYYLYSLMKTDEYQWFILGGASGTSIRHTSPSAIGSYNFKIAPMDLQLRYEGTVEGFFEKINDNNTQIRTLASMRDNLLPKLMSGEVRVDL